ncbi:MAG: peptidylprolyl isomerase [Flavobacteriales bacterium]
MKYFLILICALAIACSGPTATPAPETAKNPSPNNTWANPHLAAVLNAQDHRDSKTLLELLNDTSAAVRNAAAMAFASVQDSMARAGLLVALKDANASVRSAAAWSLSFVPDSAVANALANAAETESDTAAATVLRAAAFRAWAKTARKADANDLMERLRNSSGYQRVCVAEVLRRLPKEKLLPVESGYVELLRIEKQLGVKLLLLSGMKNFSDTLAKNTLGKLLRDPDTAIRVNALRAHVAMDKTNATTALFHAVRDTIAAVRQTAVEFLQGMETVNGDSCWIAGQTSPDVMVKIPLYGLAMKYGTEGTPNVAAALLTSLWGMDADPYVRAALITARASTVPTDSLLAWMKNPWPAVARQAAFASAVAQTREAMKRARYASRKAQYAQLTQVLQTAFATGDAGLIAAAADELLKEDAEVIAMVLDAATEQQVNAALHPIRDLEARQMLDQAIAKRDGLLEPSHKGPAFNHPIDLARLATLKEGKQYRITTTLGDIVIAIEPIAAPGTCVAFDSLVTAGFYNGKYFHRVVPNFVAQGGCPRGDGYGAKDWTMRTEIGYNGFDTGAVGIASAGRDTESCQFFITLEPAPHLDGRYTRFAHVVSGMDVAQRLVVGDRMSRVQPIR